MQKNIVFSPLYTIYSILFVFYFGCLCIVKSRNALKIISVLKPLSNSDSINSCVFGHTVACIT